MKAKDAGIGDMVTRNNHVINRRGDRRTITGQVVMTGRRNLKKGIFIKQQGSASEWDYFIPNGYNVTIH